MISLVTARLVLRRWREDEVAPLSAINADREVMRWIGGGSVRVEQHAKAAIETFERRWGQHGDVPSRSSRSEPNSGSSRSNATHPSPSASRSAVISWRAAFGFEGRRTFATTA